MDRQITLVKGISIGRIPPTPRSINFQNFRLTGIRDFLVAQACSYGFPIAYAQEQNGNLVQNIFPIQKTETQQISTSSKIELGLHTETAFHPYKPSAVLLLCLRGDPEAVTTYAYVDEIVKHITPMMLNTLTQPWFTTSIDESFRTKGQPDMELTCSILREEVYGLNPLYEITYDEALMKATNAQAEEALNELREAIKKCNREIVLESGDLLVFNNKTTIHGRRPFRARYDGTDRWVQRILSINSAVPKQHKSGNTIITEFGQTARVR